MDEKQIKADLHWYVVYTNPKQERRAESNLSAWGVETLYPKIKKARRNAFTGLPVYETAPLFPRYIFARFCAEKLMHKVCFTRGVNSIVCFDNVPAQIEDETIALITSNIDEAGFAKIGEPFKVGDRLLIQAGPLKGLVGVFERQMKDSERISLLLDAVSYQSRTIIRREMVVKAHG
jgi:transcription antitermination factor NusG